MRSLLALLGTGCFGDGGEKKVSHIEPAHGSTRGDDEIRIEGEGFRTDIGYTVHFGPREAASVIVEGDDVLLVTSPSADEAKTVDVRIMSDDGRSFVLRNGFRYVDPAAWKPLETLDLVRKRATEQTRRRLHD